MENSTETHELVRCLDCGAVYGLARSVAAANPCPHCGGVGWIALRASNGADEDEHES